MQPLPLRRSRNALSGGAAALPERDRVVGRLKRACELAQGFCIVLFILCAAMVPVVAGRIWQVATGPDATWDGRSSRFERLYVCEDPALGDGGLNFTTGLGVFGVTELMVHQPASGTAQHPLERVAGDERIRSDTPIVFIVGSGSFVLIMGAIMFVGARFFRRIAVSGEPFRIGRAHELTLAAALVLALSCVPYLLTFAALKIGIALMPQYDVAIQYGLCNYLLVALGALLLAIARVFAYGCILQRQDDGLV